MATRKADITIKFLKSFGWKEAEEDPSTPVEELAFGDPRMVDPMAGDTHPLYIAYQLQKVRCIKTMVAIEEHLIPIIKANNRSEYGLLGKILTIDPNKLL